VFNLQFDLKSLIWYYSLTESRFISFERCTALIEIPQEKGYQEDIINSEKPKKGDIAPMVPFISRSGWLKEGAVNFEEVFIKYRPTLECVLKGVSFSISPCEKIGELLLRKINDCNFHLI
jgi:ABC-type multidrug transport system fused ATPase/permease subunit